MKKLREDIIYPERSETHRTDTSAVRRLMTQLSSDWVIRDLSERDYGIDLKLEYFNDNKPTGKIVFLQVKGTTKKLQIKKDCVILWSPLKIEFSINFERNFSKNLNFTLNSPIF